MQAQNRVVRVVVVAGGACRSVVENLDMVQGYVGVYLDVEQEINAVALDPRVIPVYLVRGETIATITSRFQDKPGYKRACEILRVRQSDPGQGLGQTPIIGAMAYELVKDQIHLVHQQVLTRIRLCSDGAPDKVIILSLASNSGGTGRGLVIQATRDLADYLCNALQRTIVIEMQRIGTQTFEGLGRHTRNNNGVGVPADLSFTLTPEHHERLVKSWTGLELPMCEADSFSRDGYCRLVLQALNSQGVQDFLGRRDSNEEMTQDFGHLTTIEGGVWRLDRQIDLVAATCNNYAPLIARLGAEDPEEYDELIASVVINQPVERQAQHEQLLAMAAKGHSRPANFWNAYVVTTYGEAETEVYVQEGRQEASLGNLLTGIIPEELERYRQRRAFLHAVKQAISQAKNKYQATMSQKRMQRQLAEATIMKCLKALMPVSLLERLNPFKGNRQHNLVLLKRTLVVYQQLEREVSELEAESKALNKAEDEVEEEIDRLEAALKQFWSWIKAQCQPSLDLFEFKPLSEVFDQLINAFRNKSEAVLNRVMLGTIVSVKLSGIAYLLGHDGELNAPALAKQMLLPAPVNTPPWGGLDRSLDSCRRVICLPPVSPELQHNLRLAMANLDVKMEVCCTDTVSGGIGIVKLTAYYIETIHQVATPQYTDDLCEAKRSGLYQLARVPGTGGERELQQILAYLEEQQKQLHSEEVEDEDH